MEISDREAGYPDRVRGIVSAVQADCAGIERHGCCKDLERRPHFVNTERGPVETQILRDGAGLVRVETGERRHRDHFAGGDVYHQAGRADGAEFLHRDAKFMF